MRLRQFRLQLERTRGQTFGVIAPRRGRVPAVEYPAFQLRITGKREGEIRIEFQRSLVKLFRLLQFRHVVERPLQIARLHKCEIRLTIFRSVYARCARLRSGKVSPAKRPRSRFGWRRHRSDRDRIVRPNVLIVFRVINCTFTRTRLSSPRTLPSRIVPAPSALPISRTFFEEFR